MNDESEGAAGVFHEHALGDAEDGLRGAVVSGSLGRSHDRHRFTPKHFACIQGVRTLAGSGVSDSYL